MTMSGSHANIGYQHSNVNGKLHKRIDQPAILYETKTMPMGSSHMKKLEGTEMNMCR